MSMAARKKQKGIVLSAEQRRRRRARSIVLALVLAGFAILFYAVTCTADSGSLTAGVISVSPPEAQGATIAVHSTLGFAAGFIGPLAVGVALDHAGGQAAAVACVMSLFGLCATAVYLRLQVRGGQ